MSEKKERENEDGSSHTFEIAVVLAIIILMFFFNSVFNMKIYAVVRGAKIDETEKNIYSYFYYIFNIIGFSILFY